MVAVPRCDFRQSAGLPSHVCELAGTKSVFWMAELRGSRPVIEAKGARRGHLATRPATGMVPSDRFQLIISHHRTNF